MSSITQIGQQRARHKREGDDEQSATQITCDILCSLSSSCPTPPTELSDVKLVSPTSEVTFSFQKRRNSKNCAKQHQLPMFLSKTYHMIDRCDQGIATWSNAGDNFVVKNVEKFASSVLPLYFKHSNFSSFARQLNFYGFRKLRTDPILTSDINPRTACYVRFYHEKFQKDRPDLLHQIKRATKSDQQSKDAVDSLKTEVARLKDNISHMSTDFDRKLAEMSCDYNHRITTVSAEYDKLAALLKQVLTRNCSGEQTSNSSLAQRVPDLMQSLSVAAMSLQKNVHPSLMQPTSFRKRNADDEKCDAPSTSRARIS